MPLNLPPPKAASTNGAHNVGDAQSQSRQSPSTASVSNPARNTSESTNEPVLPIPKSKSKQASTQPKKFFLDLPKPASSGQNSGNIDQQPEGQPTAKKARLGGSGLGALLPEPKRASGLALPPPSSAGTANGSKTALSAASLSTLLKPHAVSNAKQTRKEGISAENVETEGQPSETAASTNAVPRDEPSEEVLDFFGLSSNSASATPTVDFFGITSEATPQASSVVKVQNDQPQKTLIQYTASSLSTSAPRISAAPTTAAPSLESNYYATLPVPTKNDPYPGFYQKPDGSWAAKRPDEWEIWSQAQMAAQLQQQADAEPAQPELPSDFEQAGMANSVDVRAELLRGKGQAGLTRPGKVPQDANKAVDEDDPAKQKAQKKFSHVAKSRHQLSTLIADATNNRAELEDRIAQMKTNKRSGGAKYGF